MSNFGERDFSFPTTNSAPRELPPSRAGRQTAAHGPQDWVSPLDASFRRPSAETSPPIGCPPFPLILSRPTSYWLGPFSLSTFRRNINSLASLWLSSFFYFYWKLNANQRLVVLVWVFPPGCIFVFELRFCCKGSQLADTCVKISHIFWWGCVTIKVPSYVDAVCPVSVCALTVLWVTLIQIGSLSPNTCVQ